MKKRSPTTAAPRRAALAASRARTTSVAARRAPSGRARTQAKPAPGRKSSKMTTNHGLIRRWVEARGGQPATVKRTLKGSQHAGLLRIDFPGYRGAQTLKPVTWNEWFETFENKRLAFLYQDRTVTGKPSRFNKLVCRP